MNVMQGLISACVLILQYKSVYTAVAIHFHFSMSTRGPLD